jgi:2,4-dienoyl-CoA reductase (NADPH2)
MAIITKEVNIPTIISGRVINPILANEIIKEGSADLIGLGRPLRVDTHWIIKAMNRGKKITACIDCKWCIKRVVLGEGFACSRWPKLLQVRTDLEHKLLSRNYRSLIVVADIFDLKLFQASLPLLFPEIFNISTAVSPTVLFLKSKKEDGAFEKVRDNFLKRIKGRLDQIGFTGKRVNDVVRVVHETYDAEVHLEIERGKHGVVVLGRNPDQVWRERLLYKERGKVIALIGSSDRQFEVMVPVDLSDRTLLVLMFLRQTLIGKSGFNLHFVHVVTRSSGAAERRWKEIKKIVAFDKDVPLQLIQSKGHVVDDLLKMLDQGNYGTIIMGKRGLSGIKRWMLGSVSFGVLKGLKDQSLFLID